MLKIESGKHTSREEAARQHAPDAGVRLFCDTMSAKSMERVVSFWKRRAQDYRVIYAVSLFQSHSKTYS